MDRRRTLAPLLLLVSGGILALRRSSVAGERRLRCVSDYLYTINCSLSVWPADNTSRWLSLRETEVDEETYLCNLTATDGVSSCSVRRPDVGADSDIFNDMNTFEVSLCHKHLDTPEVCEVLDEEFIPATNIKPNSPCCLTVAHNSSKHHFTWRSTYEQYGDFTNLVNSFKYQLYYYQRGGSVASHILNTESAEYSVDDHAFVPDCEYAAKVRSSPNQVFYKGQWSDWSSEVQWTTAAATNDLPANRPVSDLAKKILIPLCVMVPLILLLCCVPVRKWKRDVFIPTPAPYFHTLYSNCQGDFRSWVVTRGNAVDVLQAEDTLDIDTLSKCADAQEEAEEAQCSHQLMAGRGYSNVSGQTCDRYSVSNTCPLSDSASSTINTSLSYQLGSPAEGDSGCWLCSDTSLEKDPPWYCNDYCTLSAFQQSGPDTAEHHESLCTQGIISEKAFTEA